MRHVVPMWDWKANRTFSISGRTRAVINVSHSCGTLHDEGTVTLLHITPADSQP